MRYVNKQSPTTNRITWGDLPLTHALSRGESQLLSDHQTSLASRTTELFSPRISEYPYAAI